MHMLSTHVINGINTTVLPLVYISLSFIHSLYWILLYPRYIILYWLILDNFAFDDTLPVSVLLDVKFDVLLFPDNFTLVLSLLVDFISAQVTTVVVTTGWSSWMDSKDSRLLFLLRLSFSSFLYLCFTFSRSVCASKDSMRLVSNSIRLVANSICNSNGLVAISNSSNVHER